MRWLKRFLASDDPIVKLIAALTEPEAQMRRELLENEGVPAMVKNTGALQSHLQLPFSQDFDLYVKKSDLERAAETLGPLIDATPPDEDLSEGNGSGDGYVR
ncbi:MAG: DUF2007 domain-containing protein [Chloroflexi bacterium]|nr:DUF2007 domain-containing protein [Chloroflexota bacterium]